MSKFKVEKEAKEKKPQFNHNVVTVRFGLDGKGLFDKLTNIAHEQKISKNSFCLQAIEYCINELELGKEELLDPVHIIEDDKYLGTI